MNLKELYENKTIDKFELNRKVNPNIVVREIDGSPHYYSDVNEHNILNFNGSRKNQEYLFENLNEGLVISYDIKKCEKYLKKIFPCISKISENIVNPYFRTKKSDKFVNISLNSNFDRFKEIATKIESLVGWFAVEIELHINYKGNLRPFTFMRWSKDSQPTKDSDYVFTTILNTQEVALEEFMEHYDINDMTMFFEIKYPKRYYPNEKQIFYHLTDYVVFKKKISKEGLIPRTSGNYPTRVYLTTDWKNGYEMIGEKFEGRPIAVLEINVNGIEIFEDPRADNAYFTYDNISPKNIKYLGVVR